MKPKSILYKAGYLFVIFLILSWAACYPPTLNVDQPDTAEVNSSFESEVEVTSNGDEESKKIISRMEIKIPEEYQHLMSDNQTRADTFWRFGIKIPTGWNVTDSIWFTGVDSGNFVYSSVISDQMDSLYPSGTDYYWWVSQTTDEYSTESGQISFTPEIETDGSKGNFLLDYIFAWPYLDGASWSSQNYIAVGLKDTAYVTSFAEQGLGSLRAAIDSVMPGGHIFFVLPYSGTIFLNQEIELYKDINIHGPEHLQISVSGSDSCRVFNVYGGTDVSISNVTIMDGKTSQGAAISTNLGSHLDLNNVTIKNNRATTYGGGIFISGDLNMVNCTIQDNYSEGRGGGIYIERIGYQINIAGTTIKNNIAENWGGGIFFPDTIAFDDENLCEIYNNEALLGYDFYKTNTTPIHVPLQKFTVQNPNTYFAFPSEAFTWDIHGHTQNLYEADLYVSPDGSDENTGLTPAEPKKSITSALAWIHGTTNQPRTIHLAPGTYSESQTGEYQTLYCRSNISIAGSTDDNSICESLEILLDNSSQITLKNLTLTYGGNGASQIRCSNSEPVIKNISVANIGITYGSVIYLQSCPNFILDNLELQDLATYNTITLSSSNGVIQNSNIIDNVTGIYAEASHFFLINCKLHYNSKSAIILADNSEAEISNCHLYRNYNDYGAAIHISEASSAELSDCSIKANTASRGGGGIYLTSNASLILDDSLRSNIYMNDAPIGADLYCNSNQHIIDVVVDTFSVMYPNNYYANNMAVFSFDILNCVYPQNDADLYVNPDGSDENSGLTPNEPLQTITKALKTILIENESHTIYLSEGVYSSQHTGEQFPLLGQSKVNISGLPDQSVVVYGSKIYPVFSMNEVSDITLSNMDIRNGNNGIFALNASITMNDILVHENGNEGNGGGVFMENSSITMNNVEISDNTISTYHSRGGGIYITGNCELITDSLLIKDNQAFHGAGIGLYYATVSLSNIYIIDNHAAISTALYQESGGGINCYGSDVYFDNIYLYDNYAEKNGGGMYIYDCNPKIKNSVFDNNLADYGGAIYSTIASSPRINDSRIINNKANIDGGGIYYDNSDGFIENVDFINNSAASLGGGIHLRNISKPYIRFCLLRNNSADHGAGIYVDKSGTSLYETRIDSNNATYNGGGMYIREALPIITTCLITDNKAKDGGGLFITDGSGPFLPGTTIKSNNAQYGGGIYFSRNSTAQNGGKRCNIYFNEALADGVDMYAVESNLITLKIDTFTVMHPNDYFTYEKENYDLDILHAMLNQGEYDVYVNPNGSDENSGISPDEPFLTLKAAKMKAITDSVPPFIINLAPGTYHAGTSGEDYPFIGISNMHLIGDEVSTTVLDGDNNTSIIKTFGCKDFIVKNISLKNGNSEEGGAVYLNNSKVNFESIDISDCWGTHGGGIWLNNSELSLTDAMIHNNESKRGAGIHCSGNSKISGKNIHITGNQTDEWGGGGGFYGQDFTGELYNLNISANEGRIAGGMYINSGSPNIFNTVITNNNAILAGGIYAKNVDSCRIYNSTIVENNSENGGGITEVNNSSVDLLNSIVWDNTTYEISLSSSTVEVSFSDIKGDTSNINVIGESEIIWLQGNINEDPMFSGLPDQPFSLMEGSPCIDAGNPDTTGLNLPPWDILGDVRVYDGNGMGTAIVDMGAYEYGSIPVGTDDFAITPNSIDFVCYPNPAHSFSYIYFNLNETHNVKLSLYNTRGKEIQVLLNETQQKVKHGIRINTSDLSPGIYIIRLQSDEMISSGKLIVL